MSATTSQIEAELIRLARARIGKTFCPSEAARALEANDWRELMPLIRQVAHDLVTTNQLLCTQRGRKVDPLAAHGPIRLQAP
jgi:hypothetical protein